MLMRGIDPDASLTANDPKQPLIVHRVEQVRRRIRRPAPVVRHRPMREMIIDVPGMDRAVFAHESKHGLRSPAGWVLPPPGNGSPRPSPAPTAGRATTPSE